MFFGAPGSSGNRSFLLLHMCRWFAPLFNLKNSSLAGAERRYHSHSLAVAELRVPAAHVERSRKQERPLPSGNRGRVTPRAAIQPLSSESERHQRLARLADARQGVCQQPRLAQHGLAPPLAGGLRIRLVASLSIARSSAGTRSGTG